MDISQLNIRARMAYGVDCFIAYLNHSGINPHQYEAEISIFSQFTSATNLADWDKRAKGDIYTKYSDDMLKEPIPSLCDKLYRIGASELYGQPTSCKESEDILTEITGLLHSNHIAVPNLSAYAAHVLNSPTSTDDYFGEPFVYADF